LKKQQQGQWQEKKDPEAIPTLCFDPNLEDWLSQGNTMFQSHQMLQIIIW
jgi:hypothetical protein